MSGTGAGLLVFLLVALLMAAGVPVAFAFLGANLVGAMRLVEQMGPDAAVVTILPDSNKKYLSTALFQAEPPRDEYLTPHIALDSYIATR